MDTTTSYKIALDKGSKKFVCPSCNQRRFVRMKDFESGEYLPDHVGRCDRENDCGYHYTFKQYLSEIGSGHEPKLNKMEPVIIEKRIDFMPFNYVEKSMIGYTETNFANYLITLFRSDVACRALRKYFVGRSRNDSGKACIFWRVDKDKKVRTGKIMAYKPDTGKRCKEINPTWVHNRLQNFNFHLCFFGEHLLSTYPDATVGIVESEKTAVIASIFMPDIVWLATGGKHGCKWREYAVYKVLENRAVILFPDFGSRNIKTGKNCFDEWTERANHIQERLKCSIKVNRLLEEGIPEEERVNDFDLADMLIKQCPETGVALSDDGLPAFWDYNEEFKIRFLEEIKLLIM